MADNEDNTTAPAPPMRRTVPGAGLTRPANTLGKYCQCGATLGDHSEAPPYGNMKTGCNGFSLLTGQGPATPDDPDPELLICQCGASLNDHDADPPYDNPDTKCGAFSLAHRKRSADEGTGGAVQPMGPDPTLSTKPCQCGATLGEHDKDPPHGCNKTQCPSFRLVV